MLRTCDAPFFTTSVRQSRHRVAWKTGIIFARREPIAARSEMELKMPNII